MGGLGGNLVVAAMIMTTCAFGAARPGMCTTLYQLWEGYPSDFQQSKPVKASPLPSFSPSLGTCVIFSAVFRC